MSGVGHYSRSHFFPAEDDWLNGLLPILPQAHGFMQMNQLISEFPPQVPQQSDGESYAFLGGLSRDTGPAVTGPISHPYAAWGSGFSSAGNGLLDNNSFGGPNLMGFATYFASPQNFRSQVTQQLLGSEGWSPNFDLAASGPVSARSVDTFWLLVINTI